MPEMGPPPFAQMWNQEQPPPMVSYPELIGFPCSDLGKLVIEHFSIEIFVSILKIIFYFDQHCGLDLKLEALSLNVYHLAEDYQHQTPMGVPAPQRKPEDVSHQWPSVGQRILGKGVECLI